MGWRSTSCCATSLILDFSTTSRITALTMTASPPSSQRLARRVRQPCATLQQTPTRNAPRREASGECPSDPVRERRISSLPPFGRGAWGGGGGGGVDCGASPQGRQRGGSPPAAPAS